MVFESVPLKDNHVVSPTELVVTELKHKTEEPRLYIENSFCFEFVPVLFSSLRTSYQNLECG